MKTPEKIAATVVRSITLDEAYGWPPGCFGVFHQAERPVQAPKSTNSAADAKETATDE